MFWILEMLNASSNGYVNMLSFLQMSENSDTVWRWKEIHDIWNGTEFKLERKISLSVSLPISSCLFSLFISQSLPLSLSFYVSFFFFLSFFWSLSLSLSILLICLSACLLFSLSFSIFLSFYSLPLFPCFRLSLCLTPHSLSPSSLCLPLRCWMHPHQTVEVWTSV